MNQQGFREGSQVNSRKDDVFEGLGDNVLESDSMLYGSPPQEFTHSEFTHSEFARCCSEFVQMCAVVKCPGIFKCQGNIGCAPAEFECEMLPRL